MAELQWRKHSRIIDEIFFAQNEIFKRQSEEYHEFWAFVDKYEKIKAKKSIHGKPRKHEGKKKHKSSDGEGMKNIDKSKRINFALKTEDYVRRFQDFQKIHHYDESKEGCLCNDDIKEFCNIILYFLDFQQKLKFNKLAKLRRDQENLPIRQYKDQIIYAAKSSQVVIIAGDTGCGKSTQVPQYLLAGGFKKVACTQPRRIACISLSKRVGYETLNEYGSEVAYQVRFDANKTKATCILFLTEGLLLRQFQTDPELCQYDVVVVDEVHERHLNGDFLLGVLRCLLQQRRDLKLVLMSATININLFATYFEGAPIIQVPGRLYSIDVQYVPHFIESKERSGRTERLDPSPYLRIMQLIDKKHPSSERGDLLIFMSGMSEIEAIVEAANEYAQKTKRWIILPLHSSLSIEDQDKVFDIAPEGVRKCIVSTNIAETSITIDGIRFIADSGKVKEMNFDSQLKMERLQEFWISQASAEQRKGRAGRTGPGVCFRLYSHDDYSAFDEYSTPEIKRVPLDNLVLQMASLGLRDATKFPFIEPPSRSSLEGATAFLKQQNAIDENGDLTTIGRMLALLPVDVVVGKMLIMGTLFDMIDPVLVIAAALSVQSPFTRRIGDEFQVDVDHRRLELQSEHGDPFTLLNVYDEWLRMKADRHANSRKWCKRRAIEEERLYEISKLKRQFERLLIDHRLVEKRGESDRNKTKEEYAGEKRKLMDLKREYRQQTRKRKVLKLEDNEGKQSDGDDDDDEKIDIQAVQFELTHDLDKLQKSITNRRFSFRDVNILKIIICSGLYPQVAVPDESNPWRRDSDMTFHSKEKQFLCLHPTSVYAIRPELLSQDNTAHDNTGDERKIEGRCEGNKEFLAFVSLLETNKPFIMNSMRVPVLQILLLFSRSLDTNSDCTRIICDGWLELSFKDCEKAQSLLSDVIKLRSAWEELLEIRLSLVNNDSIDKEIVDQRASSLKQQLSRKLAEFVDSNIRYNHRRILSSEKGYLYATSLGHSEEDADDSGGNSKIDSNHGDGSDRDISYGYHGDGTDGSSDNKEERPIPKNIKQSFLPINEGVPHPTKGGLRVNDYLTFGCIRDEVSAAVAQGQAEYLREHYHCPSCGAHLICNVLERLQHDKDCHHTRNQEQRESVRVKRARKETDDYEGHSVINMEGDESDETKIKQSEDEKSRKSAELDRALSSKCHSAVPRKKYFCDSCNKDFEMTPSEILKHKKSHK